MSDSEDEDFIKYGTPLDPLDEDCAPRKKQFSLEDQVAKDKHGRRRFHGAFTGGFSAGFFNSVGSLEGWKPSQFKSSCNSKTQSHVQKAEDFMDEEDMEEFGIAPKVLRATKEYDGTVNKNERKRQMMFPSDGPIPGEPVLRNLLEPAKETVGVKLLIKMGWKPGQGVGPRISKTEKNKSSKLYSCSLPDQEKALKPNVEMSNDDDSDCEYIPENMTFAPDDYEPYIVKPKDNFFGLGYSGLDRRPVLSSHVNLFATSSLVMKDKHKKVSIKGQAFGVGAFEEEDEDIYAKDDMSQYDFALDTPSMLAEKRKKEKHSKQLLALPPSGTQILEGFILASNSTVRKKLYPPPQLPQGFIPQHVIRASRFERKDTIMDKNLVSGQQRLTALERAAIVNDVVPFKVADKPQEDSTLHNVLDVEDIERTSSQFKPFKADLDKQERYEKYLTLDKLGQADRLSSLQPLSMTEWEQQREKSEFEQASKLFRPLAADMGDRFVTAARTDDDLTPLALPKPKWSQSHVSNDTMEAAKMKMYGRLTRFVEDWYPCGVLCKRFNVPEPHSGSSLSQNSMKTSRPKFSVFNFLEAATYNVHASSSKMDNKSIDLLTVYDDSPDLTKPAIVGEMKENKAIVDKGTPALHFDDPPNKEDLFKAIFLSSSDESELEDAEMSKSKSFQNNQVESTSGVTSEITPAQINILRNTSPPRGIFANLDLDAINVPKKKIESELKVVENKERKEEIVTTPITESSSANNDLLYGPCLPTSLPVPQTVPVNKPLIVSVVDSNDEWTSDDDEKSSEKRHKHKKKRKKKYYKKEKKSRDHKKHRHKRKKQS